MSARILPPVAIEELRKVKLTRWEGLDSGAPKLVRETWVYFIQGDDGGPVKIGRTETWPGQRVADLQCGYPYGWLRVVGLMRGPLGLEKDLHRQFHHLRIRGEWFSINDELHAFISSLPEQTP